MRKIIVRLVVVFIFVIALGVGGYTAYETYQYQASAYTLDLSAIQDLDGTKFVYLEEIDNHLVYEVDGVNLLNQKQSFKVEYTCEDVEIEQGKNLRFFDLMGEINSHILSNSYVVIYYEIPEQDISGELKVHSIIDQIKIKPLLIDPNEDILTYFRAGGIKVASMREDFSFTIPFTDFVRESIKEVYGGRPYIVIPFGPNSEKFVIVNSKYDVDKNYDFFKDIYQGKFKEDESNYFEAIRDSFNSLPYELKRKMWHNNLKLIASDHSEITDAYLNGFIDEVKDKGVESFREDIGGSYSSMDNIIVLNTSEDNTHHAKILDFRKSYYDFDLSSKYLQDKYGGKVLKVDNLDKLIEYYESQMVNTLYHEIGHYIDNHSDSTITLSDVQMDEYGDVYGYYYDSAMINEHIAYAYGVYLEDKAYLKMNLPQMYEMLTEQMEQIRYTELEEYDEYLNVCRDWVD